MLIKNYGNPETLRQESKRLRLEYKRIWIAKKRAKLDEQANTLSERDTAAERTHFVTDNLRINSTNTSAEQGTGTDTAASSLNWMLATIPLAAVMMMMVVIM